VGWGGAFTDQGQTSASMDSQAQCFPSVVCEVCTLICRRLRTKRVTRERLQGTREKKRRRKKAKNPMSMSRPFKIGLFAFPSTTL